MMRMKFSSVKIDNIYIIQLNSSYQKNEDKLLQANQSFNKQDSKGTSIYDNFNVVSNILLCYS